MTTTAAIIAAGEARADAMRNQPRDTLIRIAPEPRPPWLVRVWPHGVLACVFILALIGVGND